MKSLCRSNSPRWAAILAVVLASCLLSSCFESPSDSGNEESAGKPVVHAVNYPLTYFADRIAGDAIELNFLPGKEDGDPAFWAPSEDDIATLQKADLILLNGATYAKWVEKVSLPQSILADTSASFAGQFIEIKKETTHSHGKDGEHSHAGTAFTTWIDLKQAALQAEAVRDALIDLLPEAKEDFTANADQLLKDIAQLDADLEQVTSTFGSVPLVASHPVYQYFARRYGLQIEALLWEPETVPDAAAMEDLQAILEKHPAKWMIWEGDPAAESVSKLADLGVQSIVFDPCGNGPDEGDWLSIMRQNISNLQTIK